MENQTEKNIIESKGTKTLNFIENPPLYYSLHLALHLSIILSEPNNYNWFYSLFMQVCFNNNYKNYSKSHLFSIYPGTELRPGQQAASLCLTEIYADRTIFKIDNNNIINFIVQSINEGYYVGALLDVTKLPNTRYEGLNYFKHGTMIYGYNMNTHLFTILDFDSTQHLKIIQISYTDYLSAFNSVELLKEFNGFNNSFNLYKPKINPYKITKEVVLEGIDDYLSGIDLSLKYQSVLPKYIDQTWGIMVYDKVIEYLDWIYTQKIDIDYRIFHAIYEHKKIMLERFFFLEKNSIYFIKNNLLLKIMYIIEQANKIRLMVLKYNLSGKKELSIIKRISSYLLDLYRNEKNTYEDIISDMLIDHYR